MRHINPPRCSSSGEPLPNHWVLMACPPWMTRHVSKWVHHSARQKWRNAWSQQLFADIAAYLNSPNDHIKQYQSVGPLMAQAQDLLLKYPNARLVDAHRPKMGNELDPLTKDQPSASDARWSVPGSEAFVGLGLMLAAE
jgi:hypothetical protein